MKIVTAYLHIDKSYARDVIPEDDTVESDEQCGRLISALYEVEFKVDVDTGDIIAVQGKDIRNTPDYQE